MTGPAAPGPGAARAAVDEGLRPDQYVAQAREAAERMHAIAAETKECSQRRLAAVRTLRDRFGWSHQDVADALGISRTHAQQLYAAGGPTTSPPADDAHPSDPGTTD